MLVLAACTGGPPESGERAPQVSRSGAGGVEQRAVHTATPLPDGSVLVAGGCVVDGCTLATTSTVLLRGDGDVEVAPMAAARDAHTATLLASGEVLVTGGFSGEGRPPLADAEVYDPRSRAWTPTPPLQVGRGGHAAARLRDGRVVVAGGWVGPRRYTATSEIYDPGTGRFEPGPELPEAADGLAAVSLADGSVLVTGGQTAPGVGTASAVVVSADGGLESVGPLAQARFKHTMVALPGGRVLVVGGTSTDTDLLSSTEVYDPATRRFTTGPTMASGRYKLSGSATVLPDGRVVVAGGGPGVEVIDVRRGTSTPVAAADIARASFSTVSVVGEAVRVLGGYDGRIRLTGTDLTLPLAALDL